MQNKKAHGCYPSFNPFWLVGFGTLVVDFIILYESGFSTIEMAFFVK